jgi:hypothetical protein
MARKLEDWLNAITKLPDPKPLVELLRSGTPMPPSICDLLAELLDPNTPDIMGGRLIYKPTFGIKRLVGEEQRDKETREIKVAGSALQAVFDYCQLISEGESSQNAAAQAGEKHGIDARTIYNYRNYLQQLGARLRGR